MALGLRPHGSNGLKVAALLLLAVPAAVLAAFAIGETAGGDVSGLQHVPEAAALLVLLVAGWRYPRATGAILLVLGSVLFAVWFVFAVANLNPLAVVVTALILFAPPIVAGWLLYRAGSRVA
jgi:cytochrome bd-type quinol oxidase subunit 1